MRGLFITFEGIEGSGKSSQISLLSEHLAAKGRQVSRTREPGGTQIGDQIRKILLDPRNKALDHKAELLLYAASRAQHLKEIIFPALTAGKIVLCDRFSDATIAYQGYGRGLDLSLIQEIDVLVTAGMQPDLTILLDIEAAAGLARARGRNSIQGLHGESRFENEETAFHERVRKGYLSLAALHKGRFIVVDASLPVEAVQAEIRNIIAARVSHSLGA